MNSYYYKKYQKYKKLYINLNSKYVEPSKNCQIGGNNDVCKRKVYFFDNDARNFLDKTRCICVEPVQIGETPKMIGGNGNYVFTDLNTYKSYIDSLSAGARDYGNIRMALKGIDRYDPKSGITIDMMKDYIELANNNDNIAGMLFDWDRTLTLTEGVPCKYGSLDNVLEFYRSTRGLPQSVTKMDIIEYYFGGLERIKWLKMLLDTLHNRNISIYILSANGGIGEYPHFFSEMLNNITNNNYIKPENYIYKGNLSKYNYIEQALPNLCKGL